MHCSVCGQEHLRDALELTFRLPDDAASLLSQGQNERVHANEDLCAIDGKRFFLRAVLPLSVEAWTSAYNIGLWVELEHPAFMRVCELWNESCQTQEPPLTVHLANDIPSAEGSLGAEAMLHLTGPTTRPLVKVSSTKTRLFDEQINGITTHRASEYSRLVASEV